MPNELLKHLPDAQRLALFKFFKLCAGRGPRIRSTVSSGPKGVLPIHHRPPEENLSIMPWCWRIQRQGRTPPTGEHDGAQVLPRYNRTPEENLSIMP